MYSYSMADRFAPRLVNGPFDDPGLFVAFHYERRAMLFDLGRIEHLDVREILKLSDVFVSHTHMDHFVGFDHLLRCSLNRPKPLRLYGPAGFIANIQGKLAGYTWNLIRGYPLELLVYEVDGADLRSAAFNAAHDFRLEAGVTRRFDGILLEEPGLRVRAAILDHRIPCLAFSLEESRRLNVRPEVLHAEAIESGPWLDKLKRLLRENAPGETRLQMPLSGGGSKELSLRKWRDLLITKKRGQKIAYVVDNQFNPDNAGQIVDLAQKADLFYCEAAFSQADEGLAFERYHLTATQAGLLARSAQVARFIPFHFSPRYQSEPERLEKEALKAFTAGAGGDLPAADLRL